MYYFTPPVAFQQPMARENERSPLWSRVKIDVPYTVVKLTTGGYVQELEHDPDREGIAVVYEGGHVHTVTDDEAALLTAAGYAACLEAAA